MLHPQARISALDLPDTPERFRQHVRRAIVASYDLLQQCHGLGGCYGPVYDAIVAMDDAKRLNAHLHCGPGQTEDELHAEDCQLLAELVVAMADRSLAQFVDSLDSEGYLFPHHLDGILIEGRPWEAYQPLRWIDVETRAVLETITFDS